MHGEGGRHGLLAVGLGIFFSPPVSIPTQKLRKHIEQSKAFRYRSGRDDSNQSASTHYVVTGIAGWFYWLTILLFRVATVENMSLQLTFSCAS